MAVRSDHGAGAGDRVSVFAAGVALAVVFVVAATLLPDPSAVELGGGAVLAGVLVVAAQAVFGPRSVGSLAGAGACTTVLVGGAWLLASVLTLWQAAVALVAVGAVLSYGLARAQLVALSLVEGENGG